MELSDATIELLRDEAYVSLCREALRERLTALEVEKADIAGTRPPFGVLARKKTRDAFTRSMRTALDTEAALQQRLASLAGIDERLEPAIRREVSSYLASISPAYCNLLQIAARLGDWEHAAEPVADMLLAFARDTRSVHKAASAPGATTSTYAHELGALRHTAERLERLRHELYLIERMIGALTVGSQAADIRVPPLPELRRLAWVARLAVISPAQVVVEGTRVEAEVRALLAAGPVIDLARFQASCELCASLAERSLIQYWQQLRTHARLHYVEDRDVDDVLEMLTNRYIHADIKRRHVDPFAVVI